MSILSDRRSLREIGGVRAYIRQVGWSLWWRTRPRVNGVTQKPPRLLKDSDTGRTRRASGSHEPRERLAGSRLSGPPA
jgi:hypothetical protein